MDVETRRLKINKYNVCRIGFNLAYHLRIVPSLDICKSLQPL